MLTDLDDNTCAPDLMRKWLGRRHRHKNFLLRVAVPEVEGWLLADEENFRRFLRIKGQPSIRDVEKLTDAKQKLLSLANKSPSGEIREAIVFSGRQGQLLQGADYNGELGRFVFGEWNLKTAAANASSLKKLLAALVRIEKQYK